MLWPRSLRRLSLFPFLEIRSDSPLPPPHYAALWWASQSLEKN